MSYTKNHDPWTVSDPLTGAAFVHLDADQWAAITADADVHDHDDRYYTKTTADVTFFSLSFYTGFDADKLDGVHKADLNSAAMPVGAIMIWSGTDANVPSGWVICNGGSGTPDLRDRFVIGSGGTYAIGNTGGAYSTAISGTVTVAAHAITAAEMPLHTHNYYDGVNSIGSSGPNGSAGAAYPTPVHYSSRTTSPTGSSAGHTHAGNSITLNNLTCTPYYYALYYIMKVA